MATGAIFWFDKLRDESLHLDTTNLYSDVIKHTQ
jgi:hypothetical protein